MAPPDTYQPGTNLVVGSHKVQIVRYLSQGGFAYVYLCKISPEFRGSTIGCLKRVAVPTKVQLNLLRQEVDAMKRLRGNPTIVSYIDSHASRLKDTGKYEVFLLMEYCSRNGLIDFMNTRLSNKLTEPEILVIMKDITLGVAMCHHLQPPILHRDIKIENVLIDESGTYKLCDFGSAVPYSAVPKNPQEANALFEDIMQHTTPQYRAPEMIDVSRGFPIDDKSDIWALGCFLYKLCYYTTPFESPQHNSLPELEQSILRCQYKIPHNMPGSMFSPRLKNIIKCCLREDPRRRPNASQLLEEICHMMNTKVPNYIPASVMERPSAPPKSVIDVHLHSKSSPQLEIRSTSNDQTVRTTTKDPFASIDKSKFLEPKLPQRPKSLYVHDRNISPKTSAMNHSSTTLKDYIQRQVSKSSEHVFVNDDTLDFLKDKEDEARLNSTDTGGSLHKFRNGLRKISTGSSTSSIGTNHTGKRSSISSIKQLLTGGRKVSGNKEQKVGAKEETTIPQKLSIQRRMAQYLNNTEDPYRKTASGYGKYTAEESDTEDLEAINSNSYKRQILPPKVPPSLSSQRSITPPTIAPAVTINKTIKKTTKKPPPPKPKKPTYLRTPENNIKERRLSNSSDISLPDLDDLEKQFAKRFPSYV